MSVSDTSSRMSTQGRFNDDLREGLRVKWAHFDRDEQIEMINLVKEKFLAEVPSGPNFWNKAITKKNFALKKLGTELEELKRAHEF